MDSSEGLISQPRPLSFRVVARSGKARLGEMMTGHGVLQTPLFMPVGTQATVKALTPDEVAATGARMVIMNTYHLWLRPGPDIVNGIGGLHAFSRWPHSIATDSGGFQAFSLASLGKITEDGFSFQSHLDGSKRLLTPEESMRIQGLLGSDIAMQLDVCAKADASYEELVLALERTTRWAERCLAVRRPGQALFGIIQGGVHEALRRRHAVELERLPFDGLALGGFSVGEPVDVMESLLARLVPHIDPLRPRYLMGVGTPANIVHAIAQGIDMFDCVMPTRNARNGQVFTDSGRLVIKQSRYKDDARPLDDACQCPTCAARFSRAYLRHLYMAGEILSHRLLTLHNLHYYGRIVKLAREAISQDNFDEWSSSLLAHWQRPNL